MQRECLAAVGLAAKVLQFTQSGYEIASAAREIQKFPDGVTREAANFRHQADAVARIHVTSVR
jgi:hypothetical protein